MNKRDKAIEKKKGPGLTRPTWKHYEEINSWANVRGGNAPEHVVKKEWGRHRFPRLSEASRKSIYSNWRKKYGSEYGYVKEKMPGKMNPALRMDQWTNKKDK